MHSVHDKFEINLSFKLTEFHTFFLFAGKKIKLIEWKSFFQFQFQFPFQSTIFWISLTVWEICLWRVCVKWWNAKKKPEEKKIEFDQTRLFFLPKNVKIHFKKKCWFSFLNFQQQQQQLNNKKFHYRCEIYFNVDVFLLITTTTTKKQNQF